MDFQKYVREFLEIQGVMHACIHVKDGDGSVKEYLDDAGDDAFRQVCKDISAWASEPVLELRAERFRVCGEKHDLLGYQDSNVLLLLKMEKNVDTRHLQEHVDAFWNEVLISF